MHELAGYSPLFGSLGGQFIPKGSLLAISLECLGVSPENCTNESPRANILRAMVCTRVYTLVYTWVH